MKIKQTKPNLLYLEGMRGLMALNVIICHFVCVYYPFMYFPNIQNALLPHLSMFAVTPLNVLINGNVAVVFFLALTGFLVGMSVFSGNVTNGDIERKAVSRYTRLLPVVCVTTVLTCLSMVFGLQRHLQITNDNVNLEFLASYCNFEPTLKNLILNIFFFPFVDSSAFVGPFWTIKYELWGYVLVLVLAYILQKSKWRRVWYLCLSLAILLAFDIYYIIMIMGLLVADILFNSEPTILSKYYNGILKSKIFHVGCFVAAVYFACCPVHDASACYSFWYSLPQWNSALMRGLGMSLFIFVAYHSEIIQRVLSFKPFVALGKISFETYAMHWPLMLSLEAGLFICFEKYLSYHSAALLSFAITVPVIYGMSFALNLLVRKMSKLRKA